MSRKAQDWLTENLPEVMRWTYTESNGKSRGIGQDGLALLLYWCDRVNTKGTFFMQQRVMAEDTGLSLGAVKRLMKGLQDTGAITPTGEVISYEGRGKPTPEYRLTCVYGNTQTESLGIQPSTQPSTQVDTCTDTKAKQDNTSTQIGKLEPEPKPETEPKPEPDQVSGQERQGKEWGKFHSEVLSECLTWERANFTGIDRGGLSKTWEKDYRPLVALAIETRPQATLTDQVSWCVEQRHAHRPKPTTQAKPTQATPTQTRYIPDPPTGSPDCEHGCDNGIHTLRDEYGIASPRKCVCAGGTYTATQEPTPERVTADSGTTTYIPTPGDSADPQSDPVKLLTQRLRKVG